MISYLLRWCCITFVVLVTVKGAMQSTTKTIPLNKTLTRINKELYADFVHLNRSSTLQVNFTDVGKSLSFIIFQVHSHLYNITIKISSSNKTLIGTNIGVYNSIEDLSMLQVVNLNEDVDLKLFVTVLGYKKEDPIPGGCNLEFSLPISPFMKAVLHNKTNIVIEAAPPQVQQDPECTKTLANMLVNMRFYMMYLPEQNYNSDVYFDAIRSMTTLDNIRKYGYLLPESAKYWVMRRMVSAYPGTGTVFVAIAIIDINKYSVYVPTHSYACSPLVENDCELLEDSITMFISVLLFFLGTFLCYFGHWFFKTQILAIGCLSGFVVTYIIISLTFTIDNAGLVKAAAISGLCIGALRLVCWWLYGIPAYIIVLSSADVGFLIASIFYYISPGGEYLQSNLTFWSLFILVILVTTICLLWMSNIASMMCTAVIGGYTAIYPLDYYMGSNLKYIMNNIVRRATVPEFNKAVIYPPCEWRDIFLIIVWLLLAVSGFLYQFYYNKGRSPFPPPPRSIRAVPENPTVPTIRRRSSVVIFWQMWVQRCRQKRTASYVRNINERTPLLEDVNE